MIDSLFQVLSAEMQPELSGSDTGMASLTSTFKDMMKKEKKNSVTDSAADSKKVTVKIDGGKAKHCGIPNSRKSQQSTSIVSIETTC